MSQLKRSHSASIEEEDDDDDETPLFSPSPSDLESDQEQVGTSLYRTLGSTNVGRDLLLKMGWTEGSGLGVGGFGRVDPVPISDKRGGDLTGIGKASLDTRTIVSSTANRRTLESERQMNENEVERQQRISLTERKQAQKEDVIQALKTYRCELCQKQYDRPSTFEAHLNSYDHHHKKRFLEMKATQKGKTEAAGVTEKKREREKKREEREMAKMAEAAGIQLQVAAGPNTVSTERSQPSSSDVVPGVTGANVGGSGGWKKVIAIKSSIEPAPIRSGELNSASSWKSVASAPITSGWKTVKGPSFQNSATALPKPINSFQSSGFSTLDTSRIEKTAEPKEYLASWQPPPPPDEPPPPPSEPPPPPP